MAADTGLTIIDGELVDVSGNNADLAIEIASPNDTFHSLLRKAQCYRQCGTAEVWIFSLEDRRVILEENDDFRPAPIPGFAIRIGELLDRCR